MSKAPTHLQPRWDALKAETAKNVEATIKDLIQTGTRVSVRNICLRSKSLFDVAVSPTSIRRNERAYAAYQGAAEKMAKPLRPNEFKNLLHSLSPAERER